MIGAAIMRVVAVEAIGAVRIVPIGAIRQIHPVTVSIACLVGPVLAGLVGPPIPVGRVPAIVRAITLAAQWHQRTSNHCDGAVQR
jgi:hypothetical protein